MGRVTRRSPARLLTRDGAACTDVARVDTLAVEEPLEIRVEGRALTVTMRTPGDDFDLALGWLWSEGQIAGAEDVRTMQHCLDTAESGAPTFNVVQVTPAPGVSIDLTPRATTTSSACGVCGADSIEAIHRRSRYDLADDTTPIDPTLVLDLPRRLRERQQTFDRTGGTHAAGLYTADGELLCLREDVGRHNAVDKIVGWAVREGRLPLRGCILVVSGRAGFELVQKAVMAGIPAMASVSASTSLAVDLARSSSLTLMAFIRDPHLTVYSDVERLLTGA